MSAIDPSIYQSFGSRRRADLDWLRVGAFGLLILYHVGMAFVTWDWHVKTAHPSATIEPLMVLLNPWRLSLLFFVSGCATRFMMARLAPGTLARLRLARLGIPLVFSILVVVPPQSWVQVREHGYTQDYPAFYLRYLSADRGFCDATGCLILPTWNHLWFVAYLLVYTLLLLGVAAVAPRLGSWAGQQAARFLSGWNVLVWPAVWLMGARLVLYSRFPETHALVGDWYAHAVYAAVFLLGFAVAPSPSFWDTAVRFRWPVLALAVITGLAFSVYVHAYEGDAMPPDWLRLVMRCDYGVDQWMWIMALLGFAHLHLRRGSPTLDYLTQGVFPFYIAHQTIIVLTEFWLKRRGLPPVVEGLVLVVATASGCWGTYEVVRRVGWLRPLFGLRRASVAMSAAHA